MNVPIELINMSVQLKSTDDIELYIVGGFVRDALLGKKPKDVDLVIESYLSDSQLESVLKGYCEIVESDGAALTGQNFGVYRIKVGGEIYEAARTRTEVGGGATTATTVNTQNVSISADLLRRDFTINAIAYRIRDGVIIDPTGGRSDLDQRILRECSDAFKESIERPLRLARFQAKLGEGWTYTYWLLHTCQEMRFKAGWALNHKEAKELNLQAIPVHQIWSQLEKAMTEPHPELFITTLDEICWLEKFIPALTDLKGVQQNPLYHPEGDAWIHTIQVVKEARKIAHLEKLNNEETVILVLAALLHDVGKAKTTVFENGSWRSPGHDTVSADLAFEILNNIGTPHAIRDEVVELIRLHMFHTSCHGMKPSKAAKKLILKELAVSTPKMLELLILADHSGRGHLPKELPTFAAEIFDSIKSIKEPIEPIVKGRHLINLMKPGPEMGRVLKKLLDCQINEEFDNLDDGIKMFIERDLK